MKRILFFFCALVSSFGILFSQQEQLLSMLPDGDRVLFDQARASYNNFLEEVRGLGVQCKDPQAPTVQIERLQPLIEKAQASIAEIKAALDKKLVLLPFGDDLRQVYVILTSELKSYCDTLHAFSELKKSATSSVTKTRSLFTVISYAFGFYDNIFNLYKQDHETSFFREGLFNIGLRSALAVWYFFLQKADIGSGVLSEAVQGHIDIEPLSHLASLGALPATIGVFGQPSPLNKRSQPIVRGVGKMAAALIYRRMFDMHVFNKSGVGYLQKKDGELVPVKVKPEKLSEGEEFLSNNDINYGGIQRAIFGAFNDTQRALFDELYQKMRKDFHPKGIETLEKFTMGIVRPELFGEIFETLLPLILLNKNEFVDTLVPSDPSHVNKRRDLLLSLLTDKKFEKVTSYSKDGNIQANYIEFRIISYLCASLGRHWGSFFASKYKHQLGTFASKGADKTLNLCANMHLISKETAEIIKESKEQFGKEVEIAGSELKKLLKEAFVVGSFERTMCVWVLGLRGEITPTDSIDSLAVTQKILKFFLAQLSEMRFISYLNAAEIERDFEKNPALVNEAVDNMIKIVENNVVSAVGGFVGSKIVPWIARCVMQVHGPFYTKSAKKS